MLCLSGPRLAGTVGRCIVLWPQTRVPPQQLICAQPVTLDGPVTSALSVISPQISRY